MFGFPRLMKLMEAGHGSNELIDVVLTELDRFTGHGWEQEDDITLVSLRASLRSHDGDGPGSAGSPPRRIHGAERARERTARHGPRGRSRRRESISATASSA